MARDLLRVACLVPWFRSLQQASPLLPASPATAPVAQPIGAHHDCPHLPPPPRPTREREQAAMRPSCSMRPPPNSTWPWRREERWGRGGWRADEEEGREQWPGNSAAERSLSARQRPNDVDDRDRIKPTHANVSLMEGEYTGEGCRLLTIKASETDRDELGASRIEALRAGFECIFRRSAAVCMRRRNVESMPFEASYALTLACVDVTTLRPGCLSCGG